MKPCMTMRTHTRTLRSAMRVALSYFASDSVEQVDVWVDGGLIVRVRAGAHDLPFFEVHRPGGVHDDDIGLVQRALVPLTSGWRVEPLLVCVHFPPLEDSDAPLEPVAGRCCVIVP